jgi:hypothetical protein
MPQAYGTLTTLDTLAAGRTSVVAYGEDRAYAAIAVMLEAHNQITQEMLGEFVETSTDRRRRFGGPTSMYMDVVDQVGWADVQKIGAGVDVGFPLRKYQAPVGWTRDFLETATPEELNVQFQAVRDADINAVQRELKRAVFNSVNTAAYVDINVDGQTLPLKALVNADGFPLPAGPNGEVFDGSTHTHYLGTAAFVAADLTSLISTVVEHYATGGVRVVINRAQEAAIRAFTGFVAYLDARIVPASTSTVARGDLSQTNLYNRAIGIFDAGGGAAEIWVKPWVPASYLFAYNTGAPPPVVMRVRNAVRGNLRLVSDNEQYPLRAQTMEREFGMSIWTRTNGAVLYTGGASYVVPTIT